MVDNAITKNLSIYYYQIREQKGMIKKEELLECILRCIDNQVRYLKNTSSIFLVFKRKGK